MRKTQQSFLSRIIAFSRKNEIKRAPRDYSALVESFKTKIQVN